MVEQDATGMWEAVRPAWRSRSNPPKPVPWKLQKNPVQNLARELELQFGPPPSRRKNFGAKENFQDTTTGKDQAASDGATADAKKAAGGTKDQTSTAGGAKGNSEEEFSTTWILQNVPAEYTRDRLIALLKKEGLLRHVDFLFLPLMHGGDTCDGRAVMNFTSAGAAKIFCKRFAGFTHWGIDKTAAGEKPQPGEVTKCSVVQGLDAAVAQFRNDASMIISVPDRFKPILLKDGERITFPEPNEIMIGRRPTYSMGPVTSVMR